MYLLNGIEKIDEALGHEYNWQSGSVEAINFQANSSFPIELTAIFQRVFDYIEEYGETHTADEILKKHVSIKKFIIDVIGKEFIRIVEHHTMFKIRGITSELPNSHENITDVWVLTHNSSKNIAEIDAVINLAEGSGSNIDSSSLTNVLEIGKSLDKKRGMILKGIGWDVSVGIPVGIFVINDILSKNVEKCQMTAAEITSVFLHEIGHIFAFVEYSVDLCYTGYYGNNILRNITINLEKDPSSVIKEVLLISEKNLSTIENKTQKILLKNSVAILKRVEKIIAVDDTDIDPDDSIIYNNISIMKHIIRFIISIMVIIIFLSSKWIRLLFIPIRSLFDLLINNLIIKDKSNEYVTDKNTSMYERLADEYVSRYQMGKQLNNSIIKLNNTYSELSKLGFRSPMYNKVIRDSMLLQILVHTLNAPSKLMAWLFFLKFNDASSGYEAIYIRLKRNISNLVDVIKDRKMDVNIRNSIISDIEEMEAILDKNKSTVTLNMFNKIIKLILNTPDIILVDSVRYVFGSAGADKEYMNLFEHLDNMLSNKSFFYSAKIASMFGK